MPLRAAAVAGIVGPIWFTIVVITCGALRPGYSHATQFISELGATGTQSAPLMNLGGFLPTGFLLVVFAASLRFLGPRHPISPLGAVLIAVFGAGTLLAGIYSCDAGCPTEGASTEARLHDGVAIVAFSSAIVGAGLYSFIFRHHETWSDLSRYSALTSAVALLSFVAMAASIESRALTGLWQRLMIGTLYLWCGVVGYRSLRLSRVSSHAA